MAKYPYLLKIGSMKKFFQIIPTVGTPDKVTQQYLSSLSFKSSNDRRVIPVLKYLKFVDDAGNPTERYKQYRDKSQSKKVLGAAIHESYSDVFKQFPDADRRDDSELHNFFSTHTGLGQKAVKAILDTFKALCSIADVQAGEEVANGNDDYSSDVQSGMAETSSYHNISFSLSNGRKAKIIIPRDATAEDIEKLKKLLDILK